MSATLDRQPRALARLPACGTWRTSGPVTCVITRTSSRGMATSCACGRPGPRTSSLAFHPNDIAHVLRTNVRNYPKGKRYHELAPVLGWGLVNSEGELWRRQRRHVQPQFNHANTLKFVPIIVEHMEAVLRRWDAQPGEFERDINDDMMDVTFGIAGEAFFGAALEAHTDTVREAFKYALSIALKRMYSLVNPPLSWPLPSHLRFRRAMDRVHTVIDGIIDGYQRGAGGEDNVLVRLMNSVDPETGAKMDRAQLRDEIKTILMVGHETSSVTATWALYQVARHPEVYARLTDEIDRALGGRSPTAKDIESMPYLTMVFNECLRLLPSVPFILRSPLEDDVIGGYQVAAGSTVAIVPWVTHRHPEFWSDPLEFMPERFANHRRSADDKLALHPLRRRPADLPGRVHGAARGQDHGRDGAAALSAPAGPRLRPALPRLHLAAAGERDAHDPEAAGAVERRTRGAGGAGEPAAAEPVVTEPVAAAMRAHGCPYSARA